ncbi:MAG: methyltransferase domain-containing protein, partial [Thermomicrobiales bacterium]
MTEDSVRAGYDQIAEIYVGQRDQFKSLRYLERFAGLLPNDGQVLDVGCGGGILVNSFLIARGYGVHGLDISPRMIDLAKANAPAGHYELADMSRLQYGQLRV